ncbi:sigma-70 family RNA polymerase sigma factor [Singulisphaera acidiphila]|uniref:RNA polymerase sigma factor, sigma-70 family n=2 Tax=Singulisphaera acidiphila TaxID=466153 RepID=L0DFY4_SINAD|nr:sigma-70 family RNA polymerase sigma factor [Singulisphaera acidiphila]AGA28172.1 RNA polymerase sigma factor, sigma-70 family [Singulisphaera acidiphila DSM 18658]
MAVSMTNSSETELLLARASAGDNRALADLFEHYRERLERMVRLRLDRRLQGRLDPADVLQEVYLELAKRYPDYAAEASLPFYLWLRMLTGQKLVDQHRRHLGAKMRDAGMEVSLHRAGMPQASSASLAEMLLGRLTSASRVAIRTETRIRVQEALNTMDPIDREVLVLRHFEMLSNEETARVLNLKTSAASNRHLRALKRLKEILAETPLVDDRSAPR